MKVQQFETPGLSQYAYVVSSESEAIVIDPMRDFDQYLQYASDNHLTIRYVTETHIHADFASGSKPLAGAAGAELLLSGHGSGERYNYTMEHQPFHDGDEVRVGKIRLKAFHTPGHTPEHLSFVLFDEERSSSEAMALFSGDFLFVGALGRPDLLGEDEKQQLAHELFRSIHERIASLADGVIVYPGHGAGSLCGAGMGARPESTIGYERGTQPLFAMAEHAFIEAVLESVPPMPTYYPRLKALNSEGAIDFRQVPRIKPLSPAEMSDCIKTGGTTILDLRRPESFGGAHVPRALNIGAGQNLSLWAGWMLDSQTPILLVSETGEVADAALSLLRVGLDRVEGHLEGGISRWIETGFPIERTTQLSIHEVHERAHDAILIDVRNEQEWSRGHIANAKHFSLGELPQHITELPHSKPLITVCGSGYRSSIAASLLQRAGFDELSSMDGGMAAWNKQHLPVARTTLGSEVL